MAEAKEVEKAELKSETEVDERGVPLANKVKEIERKLQEKYRSEMDEVRRELNELKLSSVDDTDASKSTVNPEEMSKAQIMEFVKDPKGFVKAAMMEDQFIRQVPEAEKWIKSQNGYTSEDDVRIFQIIKENKLDTPYHLPIERAKTAWKILSAERREHESSAMTDEQKRAASLSKISVEGSGKAVPNKTAPTRLDVIKKLAESERNGDMEASIKYLDMLEDIRK